uniref:ZAD domain-containing protein n=1 Tax=Anopheles farauti TaxID=69004 RepID=A0A182QLU1_9DIPT
MALTELEMINICRFCLCQEEGRLMPFTKMMNSQLTVEDVTRFTGIEINTSDQASYVVCFGCKDMLKKCIEFRQSCISNDSLFQELREVILASAYDEPVEYLDECFEFEYNEEYSTLDDGFSDTATSSHMEMTCEQRPKTATAASPCINQLDLTNDEAFNYSANFIEPGDHNSDDDDIGWLPLTKPQWNYAHHKQTYAKRKTVGEVKAEMFRAKLHAESDTKMVLSESSDTSQSNQMEETTTKRRRKMHLCEMCGIFVMHVPSHALIHLEEHTFACPHCPVRMKQSGNMNAHISTVHKKMIGKTCNICGKGFVHHKTYRYHMMNTPDQASYAVCFGCKDTLKKFTAFLQSCISNDSLFQELRKVLVASTEPLYDEPIEYLDECFDEAKVVSDFGVYENKPPVNDRFSDTVADVQQEVDIVTYEVEYVTQEDKSSVSHTSHQEDLPNAQDFDYSANYIELGQPSSDSDDDDNYDSSRFTPGQPRFVYSSKKRTFTTRKSVGQMKAERLKAQLHAEMLQAEILSQAATSFHNESSNTSQTSDTEEHPVRAKRKLHLCEMCGIYVRHVPSHILIHLEENTFACPHCPVRMKQSGNLRQHIKTVHNKMIGKTCNICGKGFVHHKTYRYHMRSHHEVGETFECKVCSKQFKRSTGLEEHKKKFHSITKNLKS